MPMNPLKAAQSRERLYKLDLVSFPSLREIYEQERFLFLKENEGIREYVYRDSKNKKTIGIGFNMDRPEARQEWEAVFKGCPSFEETYTGLRRLNEEEIKRLFERTIQTRHQELTLLYKEVWDKLKPNEQLAIEDAYFNGPALVGKKTQFFKEIHQYGRTSDPLFLERAAHQLLYYSNPAGHAGIKNRRQIQAIMLGGLEI